jgi:hypothetical protein
MIADLGWANLKLPIADVCVALGLDIQPGGMVVRCWHGEGHEHADRTPSAAIRKSTNRIRCFGCMKTFTVIDLVADVLNCDVGGAVRWLGQHFELRYRSKGASSEGPCAPGPAVPRRP